MLDIANKIEEITTNLKQYVDLQYQSVVLKVSGKTSTIGARLIVFAMVCSVFFLFVLFFSMTIGFYLATLMGSREKGFLVVAGFYLVLGIILFIFRESLMKPLRNSLIKQIFKEEHDKPRDY